MCRCVTGTKRPDDLLEQSNGTDNLTTIASQVAVLILSLRVNLASGSDTNHCVENTHQHERVHYHAAMDLCSFAKLFSRENQIPTMERKKIFGGGLTKVKGYDTLCPILHG